ncbi:hypothetical protein OH492_28645 [Vibrio chagasii]|nr:hypothetical protein [Vibrio chagasii]
MVFHNRRVSYSSSETNIGCVMNRLESDPEYVNIYVLDGQTAVLEADYCMIKPENTERVKHYSVR